MLSPSVPPIIRNGLFNSSEFIIFILCLYGIVPVILEGLKLNIMVVRNAYVMKCGHPLDKGSRLTNCLNKCKSSNEKIKQAHS